MVNRITKSKNVFVMLKLSNEYKDIIKKFFDGLRCFAGEVR